MSAAGEFAAEALGALVDASAVINGAQGLSETLGAIARAAAAVMKAEAASVIMLDEVRRKQVFSAAVGDRADQLIGMEYDEGVGISGAVLASGLPRIVSDVAKEKAHYRDIDARSGFHTRSLIVAPLVNKGQRLGVVEVLNPLQADHFNENDLALCQIFANLAAIATANAQLYERLQRENRGLKQALRRPQQMIGDSPAIGKVKDLIARAARSAVTVLMLGETGTGKELAARMVHANSARADCPFIAINCAAVPETLLESELFGYEAGAFTGALHRKLGHFELADGGTIFLDEVADVIPAVQVKLLRVLEGKEITRLGGTRPAGCDVRVIAATNRDLSAEMQAGRFREDLYYRLNAFPIEMPPLRDRREDIPLLADYFVKQSAVEIKMPTPAISQEAMAALVQYGFPGNVRELRNVLERACLMCPGADESAPARIEPEHLACATAAAPAEGAAGGSALAAYEKAMIVSALRDANWNQAKAARALRISRDNLRYRIKKYGITRPK
jgi:Nif-specific regulatory protein